MEENTFLSLVLVKDRRWNTILLPYLFRKSNGKDYFNIAEKLLPDPDEETIINLPPELREIVTILNEYSDRKLFKLFSRNKNLREFLENIDGKKIREHIRPYIEKRIYKCLEIARNESVPVFWQKSDLKTFHREDLLQFDQGDAFPVFRFEKEYDRGIYRLSLTVNGEPLDIRKNKTEVICCSPCIIKNGNRLIFVSGIDGSKIVPFLTKDAIIIPPASVKKYFSSFVLNTINNYNNVETKGFEIIFPEAEKNAIIDIERGLTGSPVLTLRFSYSGKTFYSVDKEKSVTLFDDYNGKYTFRKYFRDFVWEGECISILGGMGFSSDDRVNFTISNLSGEYETDLYATLEAVNKNYDELLNAGFTINADRLDKKFNIGSLHLDIDYSVDGDWFDVRALVKVGGFEIPFIRLRRHILEGNREFELPDKTVAILPLAWFTQYRNVFELGETINDTLKIHKQHFSILSDIVDGKQNDVVDKLEKLSMPESLGVMIPPAELKTELRSYQCDGLNWLYWLQSENLGGCLADDMGLGKTVQALALLLFNKTRVVEEPFYSDNPAEPTLFDQPFLKRKTSLIIVPASLICNWDMEIRKFAPSLRVYIYRGNQRKKNISFFSDYDIILSSYHIIRQDIEMISGFSFHYIILDESQVIKNPSSMIYRSVNMLKSDHRLVLTGTPVENSLSDLWAQLNFVNPGLLGNLAYFRREFVKPIEKLKDKDKEERLKRIIKPFILRRTKEMVASDLPPLTEQVIYCEMTGDQAEAYEKEKSAVRNAILRSMEMHGNEQNTIMVLQGLMRLRQIANHPAMVTEDYAGSSGKFEIVTGDIENVLAENHKILVFSSFVKNLKLYADYLEEKGIGYSILTGASTGRGKIVDNFQNNPDRKIFLISLKAGGVGLNLTAADYVFMLDPWWNPAAEMQAYSRAHRIGQNKNVFVYRFISTMTIEEKIIKLQEKKSKLADTFIQSNNPLNEIDLETILKIIE